MAAMAAAVHLATAASSLVMVRVPTKAPACAESSSMLAGGRSMAASCQVSEEPSSSGNREGSAGRGRRVLLSGAMAATLAAISLSAGSAAEAKDIPIFGIKKVKEAATSAVESVESAVESVESAVESAAESLPDLPAAPALAAPVQAGIVLAADVAAFGIASAVVGSLIK